MVRLSVAIQAHPERAAEANTLAAAVDGWVVLDPDPGNRVRSPWRTYRSALVRTPERATHRLVIQDDVLLCRGFRAAAESAVAARPDDLVLFYVGGEPQDHAAAVLEACRRDEPFAELDPSRWLSCVATAWPAAAARELVEFADSQGWPETFYSDDEIVGIWLRQSRYRAVATVPSLVQHPDVVPSLIGKRHLAGADYSRVAACFIGDGDAATITWT